MKKIIQSTTFSLSFELSHEDDQENGFKHVPTHLIIRRNMKIRPADDGKLVLSIPNPTQKNFQQFFCPSSLEEDALWEIGQDQQYVHEAFLLFDLMEDVKEYIKIAAFPFKNYTIFKVEVDIQHLWIKLKLEDTLTV